MIGMKRPSGREDGLAATASGAHRAKRCGLAAGLLAIGLGAAPAQAGWFSSDPTPPADLGSGQSVQRVQSSDQIAQQSIRIDRLESQMRQMNGQIEQLLHELRQQREMMQRQQEDIEFRFQELEGGKATGKKSRAEQAVPQDSEPMDFGGTLRTPGGPEPMPSDSYPEPTPAENNGQQLGAPPSSLGTLPGVSAGVGAGGYGQFSGPLDLSALARGDSGTTTYGADATDSGIGLPGGPSTPVAPATGDASPQMASVMLPADPREAYDQAYGYILAGNYEMAQMGFHQFITDHPDSALIGNAHFWLGESYFARKMFREAANEFLDTYKTFPQSPKAPESLLKLGLSLSGLGEKDAACATYTEIGKKYPNASGALLRRVSAEQQKSQC